MNLNEIETLWRSAHNHPSDEQLTHAKAQFINALQRRRRGFILSLSVACSVLSVITVLLAIQVLWPDPARAEIDLTREWAVLPLLALPWLAAVLFIRQFRRHRAQFQNYERSISASLRALRDQTLLSAKRLKTIMLLHLVATPVLAICIHQIYQAGKARPHELVSMIAFFSILIVVTLGCLAFQLSRDRKEIHRLDALLANYNSANSVE